MATTFDPVEVGARVRVLRRKRGYTNGNDFAKHAGVSAGLLNDVERGQFGERVAITSLDKIALGLKMPLVSLLSGDDPPETFEPVNPKSMRATLQQLLKGQEHIIALLEPKGERQQQRQRPGLTVVEPPEAPGKTFMVPMSRVAAGGGYFQEARTEPEEWYELPVAMKPAGGDLRVLEVLGDSMEPELRAGDLIIVHYPTRQPAKGSLEHGEMYVITDEDFLDTVKRYAFDHETGKNMLFSTNPAYLPTEMPKRPRYIGRVVQIIKRSK